MIKDMAGHEIGKEIERERRWGKKRMKKKTQISTESEAMVGANRVRKQENSGMTGIISAQTS